MSCNLIEILANHPEINQLRRDLVQTRHQAGYYKSHYEMGACIRERMQYEHDAEILRLKRKHKTETDQFEKTIKELVYCSPLRNWTFLRRFFKEKR